MVRDKPLHNFLFETDESGFYNDLECYSTPWIDLCVILHLMRRYRPGTFLEVGTHWGVTTRVLARKFPDTSIVTVDPGDQVPVADRPPNQMGEFLPQEEIGKMVRDCPNVEVIRRAFTDVEWEGRRFDMIFIDGNHSLPHVLEDSRRALQLVQDPGVVIWHDYHNVPDVNRALDQLHMDRPIVSLHNTWIAYLDTH